MSKIKFLDYAHALFLMSYPFISVYFKSFLTSSNSEKRQKLILILLQYENVW